MTAAEKIAPTEDNFADMAAMALAATDGTISQAVPWLVAHIIADQAFFQRNIETIVSKFAYHCIHRAIDHRRAEKPYRMPQKVVAIDGSAFNAAVLSNYDRYMSRPIWGGKPIKEATAAEIRESAAKYAAQASTMSREGAWQIAVAEAVEKNATGAESKVGDCLSESTLAQIWEATSGDTD